MYAGNIVPKAVAPNILLWVLGAGLLIDTQMLAYWTAYFLLRKIKTLSLF